MSGDQAGPKSLAAERFNEAAARHVGGQMAEAEALYRAALELQPDHVEALGNLAAICAQTGRFDEAETLCRRALALRPDFAPALNTLGIVLRRLNRFEEAVVCYRQALEIAPDDVATWGNLGLALRALGRHEDSVFPFERAVALQPTRASNHLSLGNALSDLGRLAEAEAVYRQAIALDANYAEAHGNLGSVLRKLGRLDEAETELSTALRLNPKLISTRYNLANAHKDALRFEAAITAYREVLSLDPNHVASHWNLSHALLAAGHLAEGFAEYEWRWRLPAMGSHGFSGQMWGLSAKPGVPVVVHAEQGFGDAIQFARYVPLIAARGHPVTIKVREPLRRLFNTIPGVHVVTDMPSGTQMGRHCPMLSLPHAFGTRLETIPANVPYLQAEPHAAERYRARYVGDRLRVGLVWRGNPEKDGDAWRSLDPAELRSLLAFDGVRFVSLQKQPIPGDLDVLRRFAGLDNPMPEVEDFADTAALISALDVVISVDTAVVHLAGALAKPVWVLLPFAPDWRWLTGRDDSPWYPTGRLFRQSKPGDWAGVIERVALALGALIDQKIS